MALAAGKTYFLDIDGTIVKHRTTLEIDAKVEDELLPGVLEMWSRFQLQDTIVLTTARLEKDREHTERIFQKYGLRFDKMIMGLPTGQRILINDTTDVMYPKAVAISVRRDEGFYFNDAVTEIDP
jgi:hypothetical protein